MMTMGLGRALVVPAAGVAARAMGTAGFATEAAGGKYDYILAGGGTAACVLANRLSKWAPDKRILVLEAGKDNFDHPYVKIPSAIARLFKSDLDWNFTSAKQEEPGLGSNHGGVYLCRGKVLGGSPCTNVLLYNRGTANDYDGWECPGWGAKDVLKYFMRSENNHDASSSAKFHSRDGPFDVNPIQYKSVLTESFLDAGVSFGFEKNDDFNNWDRSQQGVGPFHVAQHRGVRTSAASAYLSEVMGKSNVTILTEALVKKVKLEGKHARGVHFSKAGVDATALLKDGGEVILTAGAVGSPHILMLSGIGPREHLGEHGIACVADLPVGSNLQDHPAALVTYTIDKPLALTDEFKFGGLGIPMLPNPMPILRWFFGGSGPLTSVGCDHGGFFKTDDSKAEPDLVSHMPPFLPFPFITHPPKPPSHFPCISDGQIIPNRPLSSPLSFPLSFPLLRLCSKCASFRASPRTPTGSATTPNTPRSGGSGLRASPFKTSACDPKARGTSD